MKNQLSDIYEQVLLKEAEKHSLQNPTSDEVGNLKIKQDLFGEKPKAVEGPEKAKLKQGPSYQQTTGTASAPKGSSSGPKTAAAKEPSVEKGKEMKDTDVDPTEDEDSEPDDKSQEKKEDKKQLKKESFTMSAFETLFKKTLMQEEVEGEPTPAAPVDPVGADIDVDIDSEPEDETSEEELESEEGDLISDLEELQDKLASILSKLQDIQDEESSEESSEDYSEEEFDDEFAGDEGEEDEGEETPFKESVDKLKPLNNSKGKALMNKKNKVGKLSAKGGKAKGASLKTQPSPTPLGDRKKSLQSGNKVKSSIAKGDFIK